MNILGKSSLHCWLLLFIGGENQKLGSDEPEDGVVDHFYSDFVSKYLGHNGMFFGKCLDRLMKYLIDEREMKIEVMYSVTDGATHFVSRFCLWTYNTVAIKFGQYSFFFFWNTKNNFLLLTSFIFSCFFCRDYDCSLGFTSKSWKESL